jgi:hypothetical protein
MLKQIAPQQYLKPIIMCRLLCLSTTTRDKTLKDWQSTCHVSFQAIQIEAHARNVEDITHSLTLP